MALGAPRYHPPQKNKSEVNLLVKYILFSLNVLFWLFGLVMVLVGIYAKREKSLGELASTLPWFMDPANLFIVVGTIIFLFAFLGCVGSLRENIPILRAFEYIVITTLVLEIVAAGYVYADRKRVQGKLADVLKVTIPRYRDDPDLQGIIDWTQETMQCCGVEGMHDWNENYYFNCTVREFPNPERCGVPFSCCSDYKTDKNRQCGFMMRDPKNSGIAESKIYSVGCVDAVIKYLLSEENIILLVCVAGAVVLLQLLTIALAHVLVASIKKQLGNGGGGGGDNPSYGRMGESSS